MTNTTGGKPGKDDREVVSEGSRHTGTDSKQNRIAQGTAHQETLLAKSTASHSSRKAGRSQNSNYRTTKKKNTANKQATRSEEVTTSRHVQPKVSLKEARDSQIGRAHV